MPTDTFDTSKRLPPETDNTGRMMHIRSKDFEGTLRYEDCLQIADATGTQTASVTRQPPARNAGGVAMRIIPGSHENNVEEFLYLILSELRIRNGKEPLPGNMRLARAS